MPGGCRLPLHFASERKPPRLHRPSRVLAVSPRFEQAQKPTTVRLGHRVNGNAQEHRVAYAARPCGGAVRLARFRTQLFLDAALAVMDAELSQRVVGVEVLEFAHATLGDDPHSSVVSRSIAFECASR
jgi:hypothetical protein